jgi:hypothetical protein
MLKKNFTCLLIISLLNLVGCYSSEVISRKDVNEGQAQLDFSEELIITTSDYKTYKFLPGYYVIEQDTLYGEGRIINAGKNTAFNGKIAMNEILSFEQEKIDTGSTIGLILGIAAVGFVAALLITSAAISDAFDPD